MASTALESSVSEHAESSTAAAILRNDDALSQALRNGTSLDMDDIARLDRDTLAMADPMSSVESSYTVVFSSPQHSTDTKPTSNGTHNALGRLDKGKGRQEIGYCSSLSGTHGSASEAEAERGKLRRNTLFAMGDWADAELVPSRTLRGSARARDRYQTHRKPRNKKPVVVIEQENRAAHRLRNSGEPVVTVTSLSRNKGTRYLRHRPARLDKDLLRLAEEGQSLPTTANETEEKVLTHTRAWALSGVVIVMVLVVALSAFGAHTTGKTRMSSTKIIIFTATALLSCLTVLAMLIARRALSEALLAGLLEFAFGFALLSQLDDFI